jgi:hypothetical protein
MDIQDDPRLASAPPMGDGVRVRDTEETRRAGWAMREGMVLGASLMHAMLRERGDQIVGQESADEPLVAVQADAGGAFAWFPIRLIERVGSREGVVFEIGGRRIVRRADGGWDESPPPAPAYPRRLGWLRRLFGR